MHNIQYQDLRGMFTFRDNTLQSIHPHRLLFLHASDNDRNIVSSTQRFKSEAFEAKQQPFDYQGLYFTTKKDVNNSSRYSSQRKIKYFDLDIKNLVDSTTISSNLPTERQERMSVATPSENYQKLSTSILKKQQSNVSLSTNLQSKSSAKKKQSFSEKMKPDLKHKTQRSNQIIKDLENMVENQYFTQVGRRVGKVSQLKKAKNIGQNNKEFKQKYSKINMGHYKPCQKMISAAYFKKKTAKTIEQNEDLQLKKVQRVMVDKNGSQYRITIQKIT